MKTLDSIFELIITLPDIIKQYGILKGILYFIKYIFINIDERNYIINKYNLVFFESRMTDEELCNHSRNIMYTVLRCLKREIKDWEIKHERK